MEKPPEDTGSTEKIREDFVEKRAVFELSDLGLDFADLKDKFTLDMGAGDAAIAEVAKKRGIKVVSLDRNPGMWTRRGVRLPDTPYVKSRAEMLPFSDETFDLVISHAGPLSITPDKESFIKIFREVERVLKEEGELRFGPGNLLGSMFTAEELFTSEELASFTREQRVERVNQKSMEFLKSLHPGITKEPIDNPHSDIATHYYKLKKNIPAEIEK